MVSNEAAEQSEAASGAFPVKRMPLFKKLTPQEERVVEYISQGLGYKRIAVLMDIHPRTVKFYSENAALKIPGNLPPKTRILLWFHGSHSLWR